MKSKTLGAMAVAAALGFSASAFAGSSHEVMTPMSVNETGPVVVSHQMHGSQHMSSPQTISSVDTFSANTGGLELSDATDWSASYDQMAEASFADEGAAGDAFAVSWTPLTIDGSDYYLVEFEPISADQLALADEELDFITPDEYLALTMSDEYGLSQEDQVATVLSQSPVEDGAEVG
jgi:hypothetical protein